MIDLIKILKNAPIGLELYDTDKKTRINFIKIQDKHIVCMYYDPSPSSRCVRNIYYTKYGSPSVFLDNGLKEDCKLFPSKNLTSWRDNAWKNELFKSGHILKYNKYDGDDLHTYPYNIIRFDKLLNNTRFIGSDYNGKELSLNSIYDYDWANGEDILKYYKLECKLDHMNYKLKPFECVLVRYSYDSKWHADIFKEMVPEENLIWTMGGKFNHEDVIPYEGNQGLYLTDKNVGVIYDYIG